MRLLFDENLSDRIVPRVLDLYPGSAHVKGLGLIHSDDAAIWNVAAKENFCIVSKDWDFHQMSLLRGAPPKILYLSVGNCSSARIVELLRCWCPEILAFGKDAAESIMVIDRV